MAEHRREPPVSVVMPVHNGARFLQAAVDSVLAQTFGDFEFVIVDDASTDDTPAILADYAQRDSRIRIHRRDGKGGAAAARNHGCRAATGRYLAVMDADDVCLPDRLDRQVTTLDRDAALGGVGAWVQRIDEAGTPGGVHRYPEDPALVAWSMLFFNSIAHPALTVRRAILPRPDVYTSRVIEDYALLIPLSIEHRICNLPEVLLRYRVWTGNTTHQPGKEQQAEQILQEALAALGVAIDPAQATALRGLSIDRYLTDPAALTALAATIVRLREIYRARLRAADHGNLAALDDDAGMRLWMLAALAGRRGALATAAMISARAIAARPSSIVSFVRKAAATLHRARAAAL